MRNTLKRLFSGSFVYGVGKFLPKLAGFFLIPLYTRFLSPAEYGIVAIASAISGILSKIFGMGLRGAVTRNYFDYVDDPQETREYLGTVFLFFLSVTVPFVTLLNIFGKPVFNNLFSNTPFYPYIALSLWVALFTASGSIIMSLYRAREQAHIYVTIRVSKFLVSTGLIILFVTGLRQGAFGKIFGSFLGGLLFFFLSAFLTLRESSITISAPKLKNALSFGLPLVPHMLSGWVMSSADRFLLERMTSLSDLGLYNLGYQIGMAMSLVVSSINYAWQPIFYDTADNNENAKQVFSRLFTVYLVFVSFIAVGMILFSREVILIMATKEFNRAYVVIPAVAVGYLFQGIYFMSGQPIFYKKKTQYVPLLTGLAALTNIGLNFLFIPRFGMIGAAYATTITYAVHAVSTHVIAQYLYRIDYEYLKILRVGLLLSGVFAANFLWQFDGLWVPIGIKTGILLLYLVSLFLTRVFTINDLEKAKSLVKSEG